MSKENNFENVGLPPPPPVEKRNTKVIASAIILCVVIVAGLVGVIVIYQPPNLQAQIAEKNNIISSLQQNNTNLQNQLSSAPNVTTYTDQIANLESQLRALNITLTQYNDTLTQYQSIITMGASETLLSQQLIKIGNTNATDAYDNALKYSGYIVVQASSNSSTTYVQTLYSADGVNFNQTATLGTTGTATFPVLPSTVDVKMGNLDQAASNSTVTITYYY